MPIIPNDTLSYVADLVNRANLVVVPESPLSHTAFNLDSSGVAGFFGGESAVRATATVNLVAHRRWFGWYNAPGSYEVARQYSGLSTSHLFDALFPSSDSNPAKILMVDGRGGPEYTPLYSTTNTAHSTIDHLGSLIARKVSKISVKKGRSQNTTETSRVTFVGKLNRTPPLEFNHLELIPSSSIIVFGIITIFISVGGCIGCVLVADWFCLASIALGIIANGMGCAVLGSGRLCLKHNPPAHVDALGDVLLRTDTDIIILVGNEGPVSPFTRGRFDLRFKGMPGFSTTTPGPPSPIAEDVPSAASQSSLARSIQTVSQFIISHEFLVDISVILLLSQFLAQLLLIPQGTLFGQVMFVGTLAASWIYNSYLSSLNLDLQTRMLFQSLSIIETQDIYQYELKNWTEAVVFACLFFRAIHPMPAEMHNPQEWKQRVKDKVEEVEKAKKESDDAEKEADDAENTAKKAKEPAAIERWSRAARDARQRLVDQAQNEARAARMRAGDKKVLYEMKMAEEKTEVKRAEVAKETYSSFQRLLDALLPHKTNVRQALKASLVRKISETEVKPYTRDNLSPPPFNFDLRDFVLEVADGEEIIQDEDGLKLSGYQVDAENALLAWRTFCSTVLTISKLIDNRN